jgi:hypothetical protein
MRHARSPHPFLILSVQALVGTSYGVLVGACEAKEPPSLQAKSPANEPRPTSLEAPARPALAATAADATGTLPTPPSPLPPSSSPPSATSSATMAFKVLDPNKLGDSDSGGVGVGPGSASAAPLDLVAKDGDQPQTETEPLATSPLFLARMKLLFEAIRDKAPEKAEAAAFFPLGAYRQVKGVKNPERDYRLRLLANYTRDVLAAHRHVPKEAEFAGVTLGAKPRWMKPGEEGNKLGYFRVLGSSLDYEHPKGTRHKIPVTSFISWRGEWFLVHLTGFK